MYQYKGKIIKVVDGDTVRIDLDLGFDLGLKSNFRLNGLDTAEKNFPFGAATRDWLKVQLLDKTVLVDSYAHDKYGRWLCDIRLQNGTEFSETSVNDQMIQHGIAKAYSGDSKSNMWTAEELASNGLWLVPIKLI